MVCVGRRVGYLLVWTVATIVTVGASWLGIRYTLFAAAPSGGQPISAADLRQAAPTTAVRTTPAAPKPTPTPAPTTPAAQPSPSASPTGTPWVPVPDGHGNTAYKRTFRLVGGDVTMLCGPLETRVLAVQPHRGYTVEQFREGPRTVRVSLVSSRHASRLYTAWRDGPYAELTESV
jgi:pyruvate/2-oxoglutarate dehydrogenase complex dihydrolipoamide acyltransferase (E2) component